LFKKQAAYYGVELPSMLQSYFEKMKSLTIISEIHYNAEGAFLGEIIEPNDATSPAYGGPDTHLLLYNSFLALPLIDITGKFETRFTDKDGDEHTVTENIDDIFAAFTHAVIVHSNLTMIVTDIQGKLESCKSLLLS